jgi:hypothetical protein
VRIREDTTSLNGNLRGFSSVKTSNQNLTRGSLIHERKSYLVSGRVTSIRTAYLLKQRFLLFRWTKLACLLWLFNNHGSITAVNYVTPKEVKYKDWGWRDVRLWHVSRDCHDSRKDWGWRNVRLWHVSRDCHDSRL